MAGDEYNAGAAMREASRLFPHAVLIGLSVWLPYATTHAEEAREAVPSPAHLAPPPSPGCLAVDPAMVQLTGSLDSELYPTAPAYNEKPSDEHLEPVYVLTLDRPICAGSESDVTTVQVERKKLAPFRLKSYTGKRVSVKGTLFNAKTQHHHTRVVLTAHSIKRS